MRSLIVFLIIFLISVSPASALDAILGRVVSVDEKAGNMVIEMITTKQQTQVTVTIRDKKEFSGLRENMLIRIWGDWVSGADNQFAASDIRMENAVNDPTGVRKRLKAGQTGSSGGNRHGWRHGRNANRRRH